jgi:adenine C2-methylase RlmN of 23S rRNA A2503 and tRNA A37
MHNDQKQTELLGKDLQELTNLAEQAGQPRYRGRQLFEAIYSQRMQAIEQISTLPQDFRAVLDSEATVGLPIIEKKFTSRDRTVRYLMKFSDQQSVETVWMPEGDEGETGVRPENNSNRYQVELGIAPRYASQVRWAAPWNASSV